MRYKIKRGRHSFFRIPRIYFGRPNILQGSFKFNRNSWYVRTSDDQDWLDINKLTGISFGFHKKNSLRIGWRPIFDQKEQIELFIYAYNNGKREFISFAQIKTDETYQFQLLMNRPEQKAVWEIKGLNNKELEYHFPSTRWGYFLFPYFGGNNQAPQDITIHVHSSIQ